MVSTLGPEELIRYNRHLILEGFGMDGQLKIKQSRVLVVGAGGLGCPALLYLAAAGVGHIGIVDFDVVQESNLQRQVLFTVSDIGANKAAAAAGRLLKLNPFITISPHPLQLTSANALDLIKNYDLVIDGTDNFPTRYLLNDACVLLDKPLIYGSVLKYEGQVAIFNVLKNGAFSSNYRDLFPEPPPPDVVPDCESAGVLGVLPGIIGSMQANEAIKLLTGTGETLVDTLLIVDSLSMETTRIKIRNQQARNQIKKLIDYEDFCGILKKKTESLSMKEITVQELQELQQSGTDFQLIDVREPYEYDICNLEGELIPLAEIPHNIDKISKAKKVVIHCRSGGRSGQAVQWLEKNHKLDNLYNLKGGILAWAKEIDPSMPAH
jgi:molybdopterin/thiamine biosynthesis adenylyltransferase/rhodanese-related sulfurtransferase